VSTRSTLRGGGSCRARASACLLWRNQDTLAGVGHCERQALSGTQFDLEIGAQAVNFTGQRRVATVVNVSSGALLRWRERDTITLRVTNRLPAPSSIHWHGIILPADMDGVRA